MRRAPLAALALSWVLTLSGCFVGQRYAVSAAELARARALSPAERAALSVPAERLKHPAHVHIHADAIRYDLLPAPAPPTTGGQTGVVTAGRHSRKLLTAHLLTWIGSAISIAGTVLFLVNLDQKDATFYSGVGLAATAEPLMIAGTVLWIQALKTTPAE